MPPPTAACRRAAAGLLFLPLIAAACSGGGEANAQRERSDARLVPVAATPVTPRHLARAVTVAGPVEPVRVIGVNSLMAGSVLAVHAQEGDAVQAGALLAELDARETRAQLESARAVLAGATAEFERNKELFANEIITAAEFEASRAAYEVARSDAELWRTRLDFTRITAPSAGVVVSKHVEAGSAVTAHQRMFDLADVSLLVVRVQLSELDVVHVRPGADVKVSFDAYPGVRIPAHIRRVFPSADEESRLVPVEVALGALPPGVRARPGFLARVSFALEQRDSALAVPAPAVGVTGGQAFVYVVDADTLARRPVELGLTADGWVELASGVRAGELVVTSGHANLRPGTRVRVTASDDEDVPTGSDGPGA